MPDLPLDGCMAGRLSSDPLTPLYRRACRLVQDDRLVVALEGNRLAGIDLETGEHAWTTDETVHASSVGFALGDSWFVPAGDSGLLELDPSSGRTAGTTRAILPAIADDHVTTAVMGDHVVLASASHEVWVWVYTRADR